MAGYGTRGGKTGSPVAGPRPAASGVGQSPFASPQTTIDKLTFRSLTWNNRATEPATEAQLAYLQKLAGRQYDDSVKEYEPYWRPVNRRKMTEKVQKRVDRYLRGRDRYHRLLRDADYSKIDKTSASKLIDFFKQGGSFEALKKTPRLEGVTPLRCTQAEKKGSK